MKIGIVTHWWGQENYGQQMQLFALQKTLNKQGYDPYLIRISLYSNPKSRWKKALNPIALGRYLYHRFIKKPLPHAPIVPREMEGFREQHIKISEIFYGNYDELKSNLPEADAYIVGSDQVWNYLPELSFRVFGPWYLAFGKPEIKRISYAASFGRNDLSKKESEFIRPLLAKFDAISVREASGVDICAKAGRSDAVHVLDPTLLLSKEDYQKIAEPTKNDKPFMLGYILSLKEPEELYWSAIEEYVSKQAEKGIDFKVIPTSVSELILPCDEFYYPTIPQWLGAYEEAESILTSSFHGTVFAIIYHKPFLSLIKKGAGKQDDRLHSLLAILGLSDRIYKPNSGSLAEQMEKPIDWQAVEEKLAKQREFSLNFLTHALQGKKI